MSGVDLQTLIYEISAVIILFVVFYLLLSTVVVFRLKELNSTQNRQSMASFFYIFLLILCLFRFSALIYLIAFTLQIPDAENIGSYQLNIFCILFPDCIFWLSMSCFFWLVILFFYSVHVTNEDVSILNPRLQRFKIRLRSKFFFWFFILIYLIIQICILGNYFSNNISYREYASIQTGCSVVVPLLVGYFIQRMYQIFSGVFYVSEDLRKISKVGIKTMLIILTLRFITGLIDLTLMQTTVREYLEINKETTEFIRPMIGLALIAVSAFFIEILPIYFVLKLEMIRLCLKISEDGRIQDSPQIKEKEFLISKENKTSLEKEVVIIIGKKSLNFNPLILKETISETLKKFEYDELVFSDNEPQSSKKKFGVIQFANTCSLFDSSTNSKTYVLCVRTVEIPTMNRFLLEDVERDLNRHIVLQGKMKNKLVNLIGFATQKDKISFIYQNMRNGSLKTLLASPQKEALSLETRVKMLLELAKIIMELHEFNIVHGHLTPNNILFDSEFNLRLGDLFLYDLKKYTGYSKGYTNKSKYTAPEYMNDNGFISINPQSSADCYSFAIISWEVVTQSVPFENVKRAQLKKLLIEENSRPKIPEFVQADLARLIRCCWQSDTQKRPNFAQIVNILEHLEFK